MVDWCVLNNLMSATIWEQCGTTILWLIGSSQLTDQSPTTVPRENKIRFNKKDRNNKATAVSSEFTLEDMLSKI